MDSFNLVSSLETWSPSLYLQQLYPKSYTTQCHYHQPPSPRLHQLALPRRRAPSPTPIATTLGPRVATTAEPSWQPGKELQILCGDEPGHGTWGALVLVPDGLLEYLEPVLKLRIRPCFGETRG